MRFVSLVFGLVLAMTGAFGGMAAAEGIVQLGTFKDWKAFKFTEGGANVCYMASQPKKSTGDYTQRGQVYWLVAHRTANNKQNTSSFVPGYTFQTDGVISVDIDGKSFLMFSDKDSTNNQIAWFHDADDNESVQLMRAGRALIVKAVSSKGTQTTDEFSLSGFTAAHQAINTACGY